MFKNILHKLLKQENPHPPTKFYLSDQPLHQLNYYYYYEPSHRDFVLSSYETIVLRTVRISNILSLCFGDE